MRALERRLLRLDRPGAEGRSLAIWIVLVAVVLFIGLIVSYLHFRPALTALSLMACIGFVIAYWEGLLVSFRLLQSIRRLRGADEEALADAIRRALVAMSLFYAVIFFAWYAVVQSMR